MDLATGRVSILNATAGVGVVHPGWSPDGRQIVFFRSGDKDSGGPDPVAKDAVFVIDADGQNLHQISAPSMAARFAEWSPDGARIVFVSANGEQGDVYTMRPDGSDVRRLTTDGLSTAATWMPDGWILFTRLAGGAGSATAGWWAMDANGANAILMVSRAQVGVSPEDLAFTYPAMQSMGGPAIVPPPWTPATATTVGPPAPTPSPTPTPDLAPGFSWTGTATAADGTPARRHGDAAGGWTRARHRRLQQGSCAVRPVDRHVQPDGLHGRGPLQRDRHAPPRRTRADRGWLQLRARRRGRDLGIGRAVRPGDRHVQPDRLDGRPTPAAHGHPARRRPRPRRRRSVGPGPARRPVGSPSPRIGPPRPTPSWRRPSSSTRSQGRSAGPVR